MHTQLFIHNEKTIDIQGVGTGFPTGCSTGTLLLYTVS